MQSAKLVIFPISNIQHPLALPIHFKWDHCLQQKHDNVICKEVEPGSTFATTEPHLSGLKSIFLVCYLVCNRLVIILMFTSCNNQCNYKICHKFLSCGLLMSVISLYTKVMNVRLWISYFTFSTVPVGIHPVTKTDPCKFFNTVLFLVVSSP